MEKLTLIIIIGAAVVAYGVGYFVYSRYRWQKAEIPGIVEREVATRDGTLDTGPFPKVEASGPAPGRPVIVSTAIPLGDRAFYKKVVWDDRRGRWSGCWECRPRLPSVKDPPVEIQRLDWVQLVIGCGFALQKAQTLYRT